MALWKKRISNIASEHDRGLVLVVPNVADIFDIPRPWGYDKLFGDLHINDKKRIEKLLSELVGFAKRKLGKERVVIIHDEAKYPQNLKNLEFSFAATFRRYLSRDIVCGEKIGKVYGEYKGDCVFRAKSAFEKCFPQRLVLSPVLVLGRFDDLTTRRQRYSNIVGHHKKVVARARRIFGKK